uniref:MaoC-like domain-containing protein n=1 Tax=Acrobeloides nanus TaxID=290746 RepID=A0A914C853_9BILA
MFNSNTIRLFSYQGPLTKMDPELAKSHIPKPSIFEYKSRDAIIYALGIGATTKENLNYLYENHEDFQVFPSFVVAPGLRAYGLPDWPGIPFDLTKVLHGEQYIELFESLPSDGQLRSETRVPEILDKGSGANMLSNITTFDNKTGKKLAFQQYGIFQIGAGNFGGKRASDAEHKAIPVPEREPDNIVEEFVNVDQAALYRIASGDLNPLHIDPKSAKSSGFKEPILHGLCTMGFSTRHILDTFANGDGSKLKAIKVRFSSPVTPGQMLQTEMWKEGNRIHFQTKVKETGKVVISNSYLDLKLDSS